MKRVIFIAIIAAVITSCAPSSSSSNGGELIGVKGTAWGEPAPYGMVLIGRGSFSVGSAKADSLWGTPKNDNPISVDAFWMDETEITNGKYKQFIYWVRDSIIRERLADPAFGGNETFKIEEDRLGNPIKPHLNWTKAIPWKNPTEDEARAIESIYRVNPITGQKELDPNQMNYRYQVYNHTEAAKRRNRLDPTRRVLNTDIKTDPGAEIVISKDTSFIDDDGRIISQTITRTLSSEFDFLNTYIVNIYPDTTAWINDFDNAYNEPYMRLYFAHPGYNDYPVVGVSWEQATAFCVWRTDYLLAATRTPFIEPYRLPTEAEWEYAARTGQNENKFPWAGEHPMADKGCFYANFKPQQGNYVKDGNLISSRVATYPPNDFGLYDMAGNVSEWTATAYSEGGMEYTSDMNPDYRYNAAKEDPYDMKRKIVRGGSWKDVSNFIRSDVRMWEYQNEQRSYIGFRCVRSQVGFAKGRKN
ncbi:MAG: SUMF1/EgtB/PvdO family nonheme iron enzyme [Bacteroidales bacterium]